MNFVDIADLNISTELEVLKRDTQRNSFFLYQHKGVFFADNIRIGNNDQNEASAKFLQVLTKAKEENISLVLSPEYSCPKSVIDEIITTDTLQPSKSKLWALGGESLNKEELNSLKARNGENLYVHFEDCYSTSDKNYVDPLYYIFSGEHDGVEKLIILIQFKSRHMGGLRSSQLEADNLIEGENVYVIKNNQNSIKLMSFICSQAINFNASFIPDLEANHNWMDSPFLILSLQYNPNPSHSDFIAFKNIVMEKDKRELITLNWGLETTFIGGRRLYHDTNTPRSAIYFKTTDADLDSSSQKIIGNHKKGLYFLQILRNKRVYILNGEVELFKIYNKPVSIDAGNDVQQMREGPSVDKIYFFDGSLNLNEFNEIADNHIDFLKSRGILNPYLLNSDKTIVNKERLVNISTGKVKGKEKEKWAEVINLNSFTLSEADECNHRVTYTEDIYQSSELIRGLNCANIFELDQNIIPNSSLFPDSIKHLDGKSISLAYGNDAHKYSYKYNVVNNAGALEKATICYVGAAVSPHVVNKTYDELQKLFDVESPGKYTVVVFYKQGNTVFHKSNPDAGSITEVPKDNNSII